MPLLPLGSSSIAYRSEMEARQHGLPPLELYGGFPAERYVTSERTFPILPMPPKQSPPTLPMFPTLPTIPSFPTIPAAISEFHNRVLGAARDLIGVEVGTRQNPWLLKTGSQVNGVERGNSITLPAFRHNFLVTPLQDLIKESRLLPDGRKQNPIPFVSRRSLVFEQPRPFRQYPTAGILVDEARYLVCTGGKCVCRSAICPLARKRATDLSEMEPLARGAQIGVLVPSWRVMLLLQEQQNGRECVDAAKMLFAMRLGDRARE